MADTRFCQLTLSPIAGVVAVGRLGAVIMRAFRGSENLFIVLWAICMLCSCSDAISQGRNDAQGYLDLGRFYEPDQSREQTHHHQLVVRLVRSGVTCAEIELRLQQEASASVDREGVPVWRLAWKTVAGKEKVEKIAPEGTEHSPDRMRLEDWRISEPVAGELILRIAVSLHDDGSFAALAGCHREGDSRNAVGAAVEDFPSGGRSRREVLEIDISPFTTD